MKTLLKLSLTVILLLIAGPASAAEKPATKPAAKPTLPPAPEGVTIEQNVAYLPADRAEKLDLYLPKSRAATVRSPAVVIIHGGGFTGGDKAAGREFNIGTTLAKAGYVCASVNYSLAEGKRWPTNLLDCKNAVRFLRKNADKYQIDADHIGAIGGSAGGHLSLMVAYTSDVAALEPNDLYPGVSDRIIAVVDMYGPVDFATRRKTDAEGNPIGEPLLGATAFLTESYAQNPELWKQMSPVTYVNAKVPPTLILHGTKDTTVDRDQSKELDAKLKDAGVEHQLLFVEGAGHTFDLEKWGKRPLSTDLRPVVIAFFDKHLKR